MSRPELPEEPVPRPTGADGANDRFPDPGSNPLRERIIFWVLFLYAAGFGLMLLENLLSHSFM